MLYAKMDWLAFAVVTGAMLVFVAAAVVAYDPARGLLVRRGGGGA